MQHHFEAQNSFLNTPHLLHNTWTSFPCKTKSERLLDGYEFSVVQLLQRLPPVEAEIKSVQWKCNLKGVLKFNSSHVLGGCWFGFFFFKVWNLQLGRSYELRETQELNHCLPWKGENKKDGNSSSLLSNPCLDCVLTDLPSGDGLEPHYFLFLIPSHLPLASEVMSSLGGRGRSELWGV